MRPETIEHIGKVETIVQQAKAILSRYGYPDDLRTVVVCGTLSQIIEHHDAILTLIRNDKIGSSFALARSIVEGMYRGMWINICATDEQVKSFEQDDRLPLKMPDMAKAIDQRLQGNGYFEHLLGKSWVALCSYAHTGMLQLGRRFTGPNLQPAYRDEEIVEVTTASTTCILLLVGKFLEAQNHGKDCKEAEALLLTYGRSARPPLKPSGSV